jgi:hypothetical protein
MKLSMEIMLIILNELKPDISSDHFFFFLLFQNNILSLSINYQIWPTSSQI